MHAYSSSFHHSFVCLTYGICISNTTSKCVGLYARIIAQVNPHPKACMIVCVHRREKIQGTFSRQLWARMSFKSFKSFNVGPCHIITGLGGCPLARGPPAWVKVGRALHINSKQYLVSTISFLCSSWYMAISVSILLLSRLQVSSKWLITTS